MLQWLKPFNESSYQIKMFAFIAVIFGLSIVVTTIYCYARLDYVRSYNTTTPLKKTDIR